MKKIRNALANWFNDFKIAVVLGLEKLVGLSSTPKPGTLQHVHFVDSESDFVHSPATAAQIAHADSLHPGTVIWGGCLLDLKDWPGATVTPSFELPITIKKPRKPTLVDIQGAADILGITVSTLRGYRSRQIIDITSIKTPEGLRFQAREVRAEKTRRELVKQA